MELSVNAARRQVGRLKRRMLGRGLDAVGRLSRRSFTEVAYQLILGRAPEPGAYDWVASQLDGGMSRAEVAAGMLGSAEFAARPAASELMALHQGRQQFVRSFPRANRILDLGGTDLNDERGALVTLGYPYDFEQLTIVDLPPDDRHESYLSTAITTAVDSGKGPVSYRYHSMADLSGIADGSYDLVYSGQTFEHVTPDDGRRVLAEARRVLRPGGYLCLDTPNRVVTAIQLAGSDNEFIDPDHEVEYTDEQMRALFAEFGFDVRSAHGIGLTEQSVRTGRFDGDELRANAGLYDDIASCYLLAYVAVRT